MVQNDQIGKLLKNKVKSDEYCRHIKSELKSVCFGSKTKDQVFHCLKCENDCSLPNSHVQLCELNQLVGTESPIKNWPVINERVMSKIIELALQTEESLKIDDAKRFSEFRLVQASLRSIYNNFSQQKEFRQILSNKLSSIDQSSIDIFSLIQSVKDNSKEIDDRFDQFLLRYQKFYDQQLTEMMEIRQIKYQAKSHKSLLKNPPNITSLSLSSDFKNVEYANYIIYLFSLFQNLSSIHLSFEGDGKTGCTELIQQLKSFENLTKLKISINSLDDTGTKALAKQLPLLQNLTELDLQIGQGFAKPEFTIGLAESLGSLQNLIDLTLSLKCRAIGQQRTIAFLNSIAILKNLTRLSLFLIDLQNKYVKILVDSRVLNQSLRSLHLFMDDYCIYKEGKKKVVDQFTAMKKLTSLTLEFPQFAHIKYIDMIPESLYLFQNLTNLVLDMRQIEIEPEKRKQGSQGYNVFISKIERAHKSRLGTKFCFSSKRPNTTDDG